MKRSNYITAQVASIPARENMLYHTVSSLVGQVNKVRVMLNGYKRIPDYFNSTEFNEVAEVFLLDNSLGDAAKFYPGYKDGFLLTCDDDLVYPPDYAKVMTAHVEKFKCIISLHGRKMNPRPVSNSYTDRKATYHCLDDVKNFHIVDIAGTGVMALHTADFVPTISKMKVKNMADIWIAAQAYDKNMILMVAPHACGWLKYQAPEIKNTIWGQQFKNPKLQTHFYNQIGKPKEN